MSLDSKFTKIAKLFRPFKDPKFAGGVLLFSIPLALGMTTLDYNYTKKKINDIFIEAGGNTNAVISVYEKADYIRSQPGYHTNRAVEYFNRTKKR